MKNLLKFLMVIMVMVSSNIIVSQVNEAQAQHKTLRVFHKLQDELSYDTYYNNYRKEMKSQAKEVRKSKRELARNQRSRERFLAKISRIKGEPVAKKEDND